MTSLRNTSVNLWNCGILFACFLCCVSDAKIQLPDGFRVCKRNDPQLDKCFVQAANVDTLILKKGNEALGVQSLDPLKMKNEMKFALGNEAAGLSFRVTLLDGLITHTLDRFTKAHVDFNKSTIDIDVILSNLTMDARHVSHGRFLVGSIRGEGRCKVSMDDLYAHIHIRFNRTVRNGKEHLHALDYTLKIKPQRMSCFFENIVGGNNKNVNDALNRVLNDNWQLVFPPLYPDIEKATAPAFKDVLNEILDTVPFDELFPE